MPSRGANATLTVDLEKQEIRGPDGGVIKFEIDPFRKHCLLNGLDNIGLTLEKEKSIKAFEETAHALGLGPECRRNRRRAAHGQSHPYDDPRAGGGALGRILLRSLRSRDGRSFRFRRLHSDLHANREADFEIELTVNKGRAEPYELGNGYGHLAFVVDDLEADRSRCTAAGLAPKDIK